MVIAQLPRGLQTRFLVHSTGNFLRKATGYLQTLHKRAAGLAQPGQANLGDRSAPPSRLGLPSGRPARPEVRGAQGAEGLRGGTLLSWL